MSVTTLASTSPRTTAVAAKAPMPSHMLPNRAGQTGGVGVKGIINNALAKKPRK